MTTAQSGGGKLPGKTTYAGRRRSATRKSGFSVHQNTTGGEFRRHNVATVELVAGNRVDVRFRLADYEADELLGFGLWFWSTGGIEPSLSGFEEKLTLSSFGSDSWNKVGSIWKSDNSVPTEIVFSLQAVSTGRAAVYGALGGRIRHSYLDNARPKLLTNMYQFAPEALFVREDGGATIEVSTSGRLETVEHELILKSCNRCGRFLPINVANERNQLSFSNHCVAAHRRPCGHSIFSTLRNDIDNDDVIRLNYGYQLECRFCKKFEVNAAHNPQRSAGQMKEDAARRRALELLLAELFQGTPQLLYRHKFDSELADDVWTKFKGRCFNCGSALLSPRDMHLDHTRPLAYLWPLDETATALCRTCNSQKRDRAPVEFYGKRGQLEELAGISGIPLDELKSPKPNEVALKLLLERREWFFDEFLTRPQMTKERDGKITGELVVKAIQKVLAASPLYNSVNLQAEYELLRSSY